MRKVTAMMMALLLVLSLSSVALAAKPLTPKVLEAVFIHYELPAKGPPSRGDTETKVYDYYLLLGPKWDLTNRQGGVAYTINPTGAPAGAEAEVKAAFEAWDAATSSELFNDNPTIDTNSWWGKEDGTNNVSWQVIGNGRVIAGVWVWFTDNDASGDMSEGDEIIETDMVFNAAQRWGIDADGEGSASRLTKVYDIRNIATHEGGHVVGLDDIYDSQYSEITMYGYSTKGETKKISLETGDVNGTQSLYGP